MTSVRSVGAGQARTRAGRIAPGCDLPTNPHGTWGLGRQPVTAYRTAVPSSRWARPSRCSTRTIVLATDASAEAHCRHDVRFFEVLDRIVQVEPFLHRDQVMINLLAGIGIERGKSFAPDPSRREVLTAAALEAHTWRDTQYEKLHDPPFVDGAHWALPARPALIGASEANFRAARRLPDRRPG